MIIMKKAIVSTVAGISLSPIIEILIEALILIWFCGILLPMFPGLACLGGLTYFDWVGILFGLKVCFSYLREFFKAVWAK